MSRRSTLMTKDERVRGSGSHRVPGPVDGAEGERSEPVLPSACRSFGVAATVLAARLVDLLGTDEVARLESDGAALDAAAFTSRVRSALATCRR
jgi:hypothetical protein